MEGKEISLITYTKKGDPIATPVWFVEKDEKIYFITVEKRYKLKRIRNNPNVRIAQCSFRGKVKGDYIEGDARILTKEESEPIKELFRKKYRTFKIMFKLDKEGEKKPYFIEITIK